MPLSKTFFKELGVSEYTPAMCRLDYAITDAGGASDFIREYTLASRGPYCNCGCKKKHR
ncbi:MAG: L-2-amino-thiazoline-4-carboxylic acid hydrolase [Erysipelotrichaceae bacterium]|nr:L-2-amino-thiazoline-4-carboxylic acid hydrolase [Erysipelotrichaceae bacterium]